MKKRQILINGYPLSLGEVGIGVYTRRLIRLLCKIPKIEVTLIIPQKLVYEAESFQCRKVVLKELQIKLPYFLDTIIQNTSIIKAAISIDSSAIFICPAPLWSPIHHPRTIIVNYDLIYRHFSRYEGRFLIRKFVNRLNESYYQHAEKIVSISYFSKNELIKLLKIEAKRIKVIPCWIEDSFRVEPSKKKKNQVKNSYNLPDNFWLYIGGYDYRKNVEFLLNAYSQVTRKIDCPPLVLAGKIPAFTNNTVCDIHDTLKRTQLTNKQVLMPGFITNDDLPALYRLTNLLIFPSKMEGFGYTPVEALSVGTAVLCAGNSSLLELANWPEGALFSTDALSSLSDKLCAIANSPSCVAPPPFKHTESNGLYSWSSLIDSLR